MSANLNAFITRRSQTGDENGPLAGKTIAVKDNISTRGTPTTCGSRTLEDYVPPYDATVVERVLQAGATIVGKTNMDEFGMGSTTETSAFGPTRNPADPDHVAGGSSGGSAAAVASGEVDMALGSDTGGSIRNPAAFCGVVGVKPTYGLVSRYGLVAYAHSLEQIGPIAPTVREAAGLLEVISGADDRDATCCGAPEETDYVTATETTSGEHTIGIPAQLVDGATAEIREQFLQSMSAMEAAGARLVDLELPSLEQAVAAYYVLAMSEASSNLARFDGVRYGHSSDAQGDWNEVFSRTRREGFGEEVIRRILLGTFALSAGYHDKYYEQAQRARAWVTQELADAFETVDVIASPTMPITAFRLGETAQDPLRMYVADANTVPANLANLPAISIPIGTVDGLPVGAQFVGPRFGEPRLFAAATVLEDSVS